MGKHRDSQRVQPPRSALVVLVDSGSGRIPGALARIVPTLGVRDRVAVVKEVVGAAPHAIRAGASRGLPDLYEGDLIGCVLLAASTREFGMVVVTDDRVVVFGPWIDPLRVVLESDPSAIAQPRSLYLDGPQHINSTDTDTLVSADDARSFGATWMKTHRGIVTAEHTGTSALFSFSKELLGDRSGQLAGRVGTTEAQLELFLALSLGSPIRIAHGSIVHFEEPIPAGAELERHGPHATASLTYADGALPLVSACIIVKDEAECIEECLRSAAQLADEIIVYDTGSTDDTVEIARRFGAEVHEGRWRNDFGWARNEALRRANGKWILWLDADETLQGDLRSIRSKLSDAAWDVEGFSIRVVNALGSGLNAPSAHRMTRLFRRSEGCWKGALHEMVWARNLKRPLITRPLPELEIEHRGYLDTFLQRRDKQSRNREMVESSASSYVMWEDAEVHNARTRLFVNDPDGAYLHAIKVVREGRHDVHRSLAMRVGIVALILLDRMEEARSLTRELREAFGATAGYWLILGNLERADGEFAAALDAYGQIEGSAFELEGSEVSEAEVVGSRAECLTRLGRFDEAAQVLMAGLRQGYLDAHLSTLVGLAEAASLPLSDLFRALPDRRRELIYAQLLQMDSGPADRVLEAFYEIGGDRTIILATASLLARKLTIDRMITWSQRLREAGFIDGCPLRFCAANAAGSSEARTAAQAALRELYHEEGIPATAARRSVDVGAVETARLFELSPQGSRN